MYEETRSWILKGDKDLGAARFALNSVDGPLPVTTGLHCQQAVENYLKAYLQESQVSFSSEHKLIALFETCISFDKSFETLRTDMDQLEGYSIASRYPKGEASLGFRKDVIAAATRVKEFVLDRLA